MLSKFRFLITLFCFSLQLITEQLLGEPLGDKTIGIGPRAYLRTDPGYIKADTLQIGEHSHKTSNFLMSTFDIEEFDYLKEMNPNAHRALWNHYRYGVVGTRGLLAGAGAAIVTVAAFGSRAHPVIPISMFLAGFVYYMNCRHMARHYLHNAINTINGVAPSAGYNLPMKDVFSHEFSKSKSFILSLKLPL